MSALVIVLLVVAAGSGAWIAGGALVAGLRRPSVSPWRWLLLLVAVAVAAWIRYGFVAPHHAMYVDEPWYAEAACNLSRDGALVLCEETWSGRRCEPYGKAIGWPVILSLWTSVAGCDGSAGISVNRLVGTATPALIAAVAAAAGATAWQAAVAAAILAVHPVHAGWSATGETNVAAAFALLAGLYGAVLYRRDERWSAAALAASGLGLATAIRPEAFLASLAVAALLGARRTGGARHGLRAAAVAIVAVGLLASASALPLWRMNEEISRGGFLSVANIPSALDEIAASGAWRIDAAVAVLGISGALAIRRYGSRAVAALVLAAAVPSALIALAYDRFAERMLLGATVALLPAAALALAWLAPPGRAGRWRRWLRVAAEAALLALLVQSWLAPLRGAASPPETQRLEKRIVDSIAERRLPGDALVIAEQPTVLAAAGIRGVMSSEEALRDERRLARMIAGGRPVFVLWDMYCEPDFAGGDGAERCARLAERFTSVPVVEARLHTRRYALLGLLAAKANAGYED